jgi:drug/metabolite transporter (DMT)-like permease
MVLVILMNALFAFTFSAGKKALMYGTPLMLSFGRTAVAAITLLTFYYFKNKSFPKITYTNFILLFVYSLILLTSFICGNWALVHVTSIKSALFYAMSPLITALISYAIFKEKFNHYKTSGIIIGLVGMLLIATSETNQTNFILQAPGLPELVLALAVITYATGWFMVRPLVTKNGYNPAYINGLASLISCLVCLPIIFISGEAIPLVPLFWTWTCVQAIISGAICYSLYMYLLSYYSANFLSFSGFSEPLFAALYGWILLSETPLTMFWISTLLITIGLYLFYKGENMQAT